MRRVREHACLETVPFPSPPTRQEWRICSCRRIFVSSVPFFCFCFVIIQQSEKLAASKSLVE
jgi:hypothetical protein